MHVDEDDRAQVLVTPRAAGLDQPYGSPRACRLPFAILNTGSLASSSHATAMLRTDRSSAHSRFTVAGASSMPRRDFVPGRATRYSATRLVVIEASGAHQGQRLPDPSRHDCRATARAAPERLVRGAQDAAPSPSMAHKLFIVQPGHERLFATLRSVLANEADVEIIFDRRGRGVRGAPWYGQERRVTEDVRDRIRAEGFAVVRPSAPRAAERSLRWA